MSGWSGASERAQLHWVVGLAEREQGRLESAKAALARAASLALDAGDAELSSRIQSSRAFVLGRLGDLAAAEALLDSAATGASPVQRARLLAQRGSIAHLRGELDEAVDLLVTATDALRRHGDRIAESRHRANLGAILAEQGRFRRATRQLEQAMAIADELGLDVVAGIALATQGYIATLQGDLPGAIQRYTVAELHFERAGAATYLGRVNANHAKALADAGLLADAMGLLDRALDMFRTQGQQTELGSGLLTLAELHLAGRDAAKAFAAADEAARTIEQQGRHRWIALAHNQALQARARVEPATDDLIAELQDTAAELESSGWLAEAKRARLVAAKLRAESPDDLPPSGVITPATRRIVQRGRTVDRILLSYVDAVISERGGDRRAARRAITGGLKLAAATQASLGAIETRAHAAAHAYELSEFGARLAIDDNRPRELLARIEATRQMSARLPMIRPPADREMAEALTELRSLTLTIADVDTAPRERHAAEQQRLRLERHIRRSSRGKRGGADAGAPLEAEIAEAIGRLDDRQLLAHAVLDKHLFAVSVSSGRARLHRLGPVGSISRTIDELRFAMMRLNRHQGSTASRRAAAELFDVTAAELSERLLPGNVARSERPVVIVPTGILHSVPWGVLPDLGDRAITVNPSVSAWATAERSRASRRPSRRYVRTTGFVAGPDLEHAEREVVDLGSLYSEPRIVTGSDSTVPACLDLLARSDVVHIACHGTFRTDNPMFSALRLADGQLVVYDFEQLDRVPDVVVMSACSVANSKTVLGGSALGLAAALTTFGASTVVAPISPISDSSSVEVMHRLHLAMVAGSPPAEALSIASRESADGVATAGAFVALGC